MIVATHDPEFAAACATRAVLLADGRVIADGSAAELLAGGWYFATETARILGGAGGALLPEQGAVLLGVRPNPSRGRRVSWPLASFLLVGVVLAIGWLAYERRRPSARMVAVVGTLAAVAALGRDAFVALPDVKPITAIALVVGYALGPLPGFTVGAIGMLVSNFLLGQGPYTPWQMAAWGCVGLFGALVGRLSRRRLGRVGLALCCAFAALAAKEVMNIYTCLDRRQPHAGRVPRGRRARACRSTSRTSSRASSSASPSAPSWRGCSRGCARGWRSAWAAPLRPRSAGACWPWPLVALTGLTRAGAASAAESLATSAGPSAAPPRAAARGSRFASPRAAQNTDGGFGAAEARAPASCTPPGRRSGSPPPAATPQAAVVAGTRCSTRCARKPRPCSGLGDAERTILAAAACGASSYSFAGRDPSPKC